MVRVPSCLAYNLFIFVRSIRSCCSSKANEEAESAMARLCDLVEQLLAKNQETNLRLRNIEYALTSQVGLTEPEGGRDASLTSSGVAAPPHGPLKDILGDVQLNNLGIAFQENLLVPARLSQKFLFVPTYKYFK